MDRSIKHHGLTIRMGEGRKASRYRHLPDPENWTFAHVATALKAHSLLRRDVYYVVKDGEVIIVDYFYWTLDAGTALV